MAQKGIGMKTRTPTPRNGILIGYTLGVMLLSLGWWGLPRLLDGRSALGNGLIQAVSCHADESYTVGLDEKRVRPAYYCVSADGTARDVTTVQISTTLALALGSLCGGLQFVGVATLYLWRQWRQQHPQPSGSRLEE